MLHLCMALVWLAVGVLLLAWQWAHPDDHRFTVGQTNVSAGWLVLVLTLYNLARWWSTRSYTTRRRLPGPFRRRLSGRNENPEADSPPDPNFNFTDKPTPPDRER
jgi:hypothetical protein